MRKRSKHLSAGLASVLVLTGSFGIAEASCLRQVANRSDLTLVVSQAGGDAITIRPRSSRKLRLDGPAPVDVSAYCGGDRRGGVPLGQPVIQRSFAVTAVQDRCYYEIGTGFYERELGPSFYPREGSEPFTLNAPRQGDLALGPAATACSALR